MKARLGRLSLLVLTLMMVPVGAFASHEDINAYLISAWDMWDEPSLNVLIVPPVHGPLFGSNPTQEIGPANTYLEAVEDSIAAWHAAVQTFGSSELRKAFNVDVYVLGRDNVPAPVLSKPDILITTTEDTPIGLGVAIRPYPCIVNNSEVYGLANYADIFNINGQEYGHCLGANHVGLQGGIDPTSVQMHPEHDIMNGFYTHDIGADDTHLHCISNLDVLAIDFVFTRTNAGSIPVLHRDTEEMGVYADDYRTTCGADGMEADPEHPYPDPDPASSRITAPADRRPVARSKLAAISGQTSGLGASGTEVALMRRAGRKCVWWKASAKAFKPGDCQEIKWSKEIEGSSWEFSLGAPLAPGDYEVRSRAVGAEMGALEDEFEAGRNLISFTVR